MFSNFENNFPECDIFSSECDPDKNFSGFFEVISIGWKIVHKNEKKWQTNNV